MPASSAMCLHSFPRLCCKTLCLLVCLLPALHGNQAELATLCAKVVQAHGGATALREIQSLAFEGSIVVEGQQPTLFRAHKKRPNKLRISYIEEDTSQIIAFDGQRAWQRTESHGIPGPIVPPPDMAARLLRLQASFENPLLAYPAPHHTYRLGDTTTISGQSARIVHVQTPEGFDEAYAVHTDSGLLLRLTRTSPTFRAVYTAEDIRMVKGLPFAFSVLIEEEGQPPQRVSLKTVQVNTGILDHFFVAPTE